VFEICANFKAAREALLALALSIGNKGYAMMVRAPDWETPSMKVERHSMWLHCDRFRAHAGRYPHAAAAPNLRPGFLYKWAFVKRSLRSRCRPETRATP